jgi:hypothetical protein
MRRRLEERVRSWSAPDLPVLELRTRNDFFLATSSLQKAIRRNLEVEAMTYAAALARGYRAYLSRRLAIIALEDVGHGDVGVVESALLLAAEADLRERLGVERSLTWLPGELARAPGDRAACHLVIVAASHPELRDQLIGMRGRTELLRLIGNTSPVPNEVVRLTAFIAEVEKQGNNFVEAVAAAPAVDQRTRQLVALAHQIGLEGLEHGFLGSALLHHASEPRVLEVALETPKVGPWLAPALDQYTRAGLRSIERFVVRCAPLARLLGNVSSRNRVGVASSLIFAAEGGLLHRTCVYRGTAALTRWCAEASLASAGAGG